MSEADLIVRLYYVPQSFPCGSQSSCCGPTGQSEQEVKGYVSRLEENVPGVQVQPIDASQKINLGRGLPVTKLLNTFGESACPIFTVNGEVISMGPPEISELIKLMQERISDKGKSMNTANPEN